MLQTFKIVLQRSATVLCAVTISMACVLLIALLNISAMADYEKNTTIHNVVLQGPENNQISKYEKEEEPEPEKPKELMTFDLDMPTPEEIEPEPLEFNMNLPTPELGPIMVAIRKPVEKPTPPTPQPKQDSPKPQTPSKPTVHRSDRIDQPPRALANNPPPTYPAREKRLGIEDVVHVKIIVNESGRVEDIKFLTGNEIFRKAVEKVIFRWRFTQPIHGGKPVKTQGIQVFRFRKPGSN